MTTKERAALQAFVNKYEHYRKQEDKAFKALQKANKEKGSGHAWCSAGENFKDLLAAGYDYTQTYNSYVKYSAMQDAISELGRVLAGVNFWK